MIPSRSVSYYTLHPWPLELDDSNLMLIGVGLASRTPIVERPSVMDAAAPSTQVQPMIIQTTPPVVVPPVPAPVPIAASRPVVASTPSPLPAMAPSPIHIMTPSPSPAS